MSANRHLGRIIALQTLYEIAFREECKDDNLVAKEVLSRNIDRYRATLDDKDFIAKLVDGVSKKSAQLDKKLQPIAPEWPLAQISKVDLCILRIGAYELTNNDDVPKKVVINEAVELAKAFGGENSSKFINGVLGTLLKQIEPPATKKEKPPAKKKTKEGSK